MDGCLVVGGGKSQDGSVDSVEVLEADGCLWSGIIESLATPVHGHCMVATAEHIVVVGGSPDSYGSTWVYNIEERIWKNGRDPQKDRASHDCAKVMIAGEEAVLVAGNDFSPQDLAEVL